MIDQPIIATIISPTKQSKSTKSKQSKSSIIQPAVQHLVQCVKPTWIEHGQLPILSVDICQSINRIVTGGADHQVKVWALDAVIDQSVERSNDVPKLMCSMGNHERAVNAVKFSPDGSLIASGADGDQPSILIWRRTNQSSSSPAKSSNISKNASYEKWSLVAHLRGHSIDVQDLAFDASGTYLASGSVDSSVIIWDMQPIKHSNNQSIKPLRILRGHDSWVKGVAWDPIGRYLASFSEDNCLIIWDVHDQFSIKQKITDGFQSAISQSAQEKMNSGRSGINMLMRQVVFSRLSWAPDGQSLAVSRGFTVGQTNNANKSTKQSKGRFPVSHIFLRNSWKAVVCLVGHRHPTTVTRFNPHCWIADPTLNQSVVPSNVRRSGRTSSQSNQSTQPTIFGIVAVGSMDETITVWATNQSTGPIAHIKPFASHQSVEDLAWLADGLTLIASSHDGSVAAFVFHEANFAGRKLNEQQLKAHLSDLYGDRSINQFDLIESPLTMEYISQAPTNPQPSMPAPINQPISQPINIAAVQTETRRADGRRKVRPVNLEPDQSINQSVNQLSLPPELAFDADKSKEAPSSATPNKAAQSKSSDVSKSSSNQPVNQTENQAEPRLVDGSKDPLLKASISQTESQSVITPTTGQTQPANTTTTTSTNSQVAPKRKRDVDLTHISTKRKKLTNSQSAKDASTHSAQAKETTKKPAVEPVTPLPTSQPVDTRTTRPTNQSTNQSISQPKYFIDPLRPLNQFLAYLPTHADALPIASSHITNDASVNQSINQRVIEASVTNTKQSISGVKSWTLLKCFDRQASNRSTSLPTVEHWRTLLPHSCVGLKINQSVNRSANQTRIVCVTRDGDRGFLHLLNSVGRAVYQPIVMMAPVAYLSISQSVNHSDNTASQSVNPSIKVSQLILVTCDGQLKVFDLSTNRCVINQSIKQLLFETGVNVIVNCQLINDNQPILTINQLNERPTTVQSTFLSADPPHHQSIYLFDKNLDSWLTMGNTDYYASDLHTLIKQTASVNQSADQSINQSINLHTLQLTAVQSLMNEKGLYSTLLSTPQSVKQMHTVHHIETQIAIAQSVNQSNQSVDYQRWVYLYVQQLSKLIDQYKDELSINQTLNSHQRTTFSMHKFALNRLADFLNTLMVLQSTDTSITQSINHSRVLQSVLPILVNNRQLQRLATQVAESINETNKREQERQATLQSISQSTDQSAKPQHISLFDNVMTSMKMS